MRSMKSVYVDKQTMHRSKNHVLQETWSPQNRTDIDDDENCDMEHEKKMATHVAHSPSEIQPNKKIIISGSKFRMMSKLLLARICQGDTAIPKIQEDKITRSKSSQKYGISQ